MADAGKIVITPKGAYSSTKTYEWLDEVSYNGNAYVALKTVTGVTPSDDGVNWRLFMSSADVDANVLVPKFTEASTRSNIVSGENLSTMFGKIKKWFTDLKSHAFKDLVNNLTTSTTGSALDASQGKILKDEVDGVNRNLTQLEYSDVAGGKNINNNENANLYVDIPATSIGYNSGDAGIVIDVSGLSAVTISTKVQQERYRVALCDSIPTGTNTVTGYNGVNKDGKSESITIQNISHKYLVVNATDISSIQVEKGTTSTPYVPFIPSIKMLAEDTEKINNDLLYLNKTITETYTTNTDFSKIVGGTVSSAGLTNIEYTIPTEISSAGLGTQSNNSGTLVDALKKATSKITDFFSTLYDAVKVKYLGNIALSFTAQATYDFNNFKGYDRYTLVFKGTDKNQTDFIREVLTIRNVTLSGSYVGKACLNITNKYEFEPFVSIYTSGTNTNMDVLMSDLQGISMTVNNLSIDVYGEMD